MADTMGAGDTVICSSASFKGEIASEGALRIDGKFELIGNVQVNPVARPGASGVPPLPPAAAPLRARR